MSVSSKTALVILPRGFAARQLAQTDFLPSLQAAGVRVVVLTPGAATPTTSAAVRDDLLAIERLETEPAGVARGPWATRASFLAKALRRAGMNGRKNPAFADRYRRMRKRNAKLWPAWFDRLFHLMVTQVMWRSRLIRRAVCRLDIALSPTGAHARVFDQYRPDVVIGASLGYFPQDEAVFQEAVRRGIPTVALSSGWDNPTTRGYRAVPFDLVVAWSERMRNQVAEFHDVPPSRIKVGGVPYWDHYMTEGTLPSREELCTKLGLDPDRQILFHATFSPTRNQFRYEQIAEVLADAVGPDGPFGDRAQLVIRLHPKHMHPDEAPNRKPYQDLAARENVHVTSPEVVQGPDLRYEPTLADNGVLGALIKHCDVLVNVFSTTTLEGFLLETPVVMVAPTAYLSRDEADASGPLGWTDFVHLDSLVRSGATRVAWNREDLVTHIESYLRDPTLERELRHEMAYLECGPTDGAAGKRSAQFVLELLGAAPGEIPEARVEAVLPEPA